MVLDIIGIKGAMSEERMASAFDHVGPACELLFPGSIFTVAKTEHVQPLEVCRFRRQCEIVVQEHDRSDRPTLFIGHSLGAVFALVAAGRMSKPPIGVVSLFGSFSTFGPWLSLILGPSVLFPKVPLIAFQGMRDLVVPPLLSWHPFAKRNVLVDSDHLGDLEINPALALHIAHIIKDEFSDRCVYA